MASIAYGLRIRYGLSADPTRQQATVWLRQTWRHAMSGMGLDEAGEQAARAAFADYRVRYHVPEPEPVDRLLSAAGSTYGPVPATSARPGVTFLSTR